MIDQTDWDKLCDEADTLTKESAEDDFMASAVTDALAAQADTSIKLIRKSLTPLERLRRASGTRQLDELRAMAKSNDFVIPHLVPRHCLAVFYAKPNGGKTLLVLEMLRRGVLSGDLDGEQIFYINEDDNLEGFLTKSELCAPLGISMISTVKSSDEELRSVADLLKLFSDLSETDCSKVIIVLDTLKKFVGIMSKDMVPAFFTLLRRLTSAGATVIICAHANKNLADDGELQFAGVQDIQDDIDVMYAIKNISERTDATQHCILNCKKDRGPVVQEMAFEYRKSEFDCYDQMLTSLKISDDAEIEKLRRRERVLAIKERKESAVDFLEANMRIHQEYAFTELKQLLGDDERNPQGLSAKMLDNACKALAKAGWLEKRKDSQKHNALFYKRC